MINSSGRWLAGLSLLLLLQSCTVAPPPPVTPPSSEESALLHAVIDTRNRLSFRAPAPSSDPARQQQVVSWFQAQLLPNQADTPAMELSEADRQGVVDALSGHDLDFPLKLAAQIAPGLDRKQVLEAWINADLLQNDPHARYLPLPKMDTLDKMLRIYDNGAGLELVEDPGYPTGVRIESILEGSPAAEIIALTLDSRLLQWRNEGGQWQSGQTAHDWQEALRGEVGETIWLRWRNPGSEQQHEAAIVRSWWSLESQRTRGRLVEIDGMKVAIIRMPLFYHQTETVNTSADLVSERNRLRNQGAQVMVLDLRDNPGGFWAEAISAAGAFAPGAKVADALSGNGMVLPLLAPETPDPWSGPVWVWVDRNTASAAEVLAGFLRFSNDACLIGERTSGKGSIQMLKPLSPGRQAGGVEGHISITTMLYRWPDGTGPQYWGLVPNAWTQDPENSRKWGERVFPNPIHAKFSAPKEPEVSWSGEPGKHMDVALSSPDCLRP